MTFDVGSRSPPWLLQLGALRYKLVLLTGLRDVQIVTEKAQRVVPGCAVLNLGLVLSRQLLDIASQDRAAQAPVVLASVLTGQGLALLYNIELLFEPTLQLDPLRALKAASRSRVLFALWPGTFEGGNLTYAEPGHPEYKKYGSVDLVDVCVVPAADLTMEA